MASQDKSTKKKKGVYCQRCKGRMVFEKYYGESSTFIGVHCVLCGEILDPVILLHRLSGNADLHIPAEEREIMHMLEMYLRMKPKNTRCIQGGEDLEESVSFFKKSTLN